MTVGEFVQRVEKFRNDLQNHFDLWVVSLESDLPDYPVRNVAALREQMRNLARQLGAIRPFIQQLVPSTQMGIPAFNIAWDAYNSAVENDVAARKGDSIEAVLSQLDQLLGRLEAADPTEEISPYAKPAPNGSPQVINFNLTGAHSRVNIKSHDQSTNSGDDSSTKRR